MERIRGLNFKVTETPDFKNEDRQWIASSLDEFSRNRKPQSLEFKCSLWDIHDLVKEVKANNKDALQFIRVSRERVEIGEALYLTTCNGVNADVVSEMTKDEFITALSYVNDDVRPFKKWTSSEGAPRPR